VTAGWRLRGAAMPNRSVQMSGSHQFVVIAHPRLPRIPAIATDGHYCPAVATSEGDITLGITRNVCDAPPSKTAITSIPTNHSLPGYSLTGSTKRQFMIDDFRASDRPPNSPPLH